MNNGEQLNIFDYIRQPFMVDKPIRLVELFAGIGATAMALRNLGVNFEHHRAVDFDEYKMRQYNAIHGTDFNTSDITEITADDLGIVDTDKYCYILTYTFPCVDLSIAGRQAGMGEGTRSGLLWEVKRIMDGMDELPHVLLMENVTAVHGEGNIALFQQWVEFLESLGYSNYCEDLNANNFGIAQHRNRAFMISLLGDYVYHFPQTIPLKTTMVDYLEDEVDDKYYLHSEKSARLIQELIDKGDIGFDDNNDLLLDNETDVAIIAGTERNGTERNGTVWLRYVNQQPKSQKGR